MSGSLLRIAVVHYGLGNLHSVCKAVDSCGAEAYIAQSGEDLAGAGGVILPGVGAFDPAMEFMQKNGLHEALHHCRSQEIPLLGICLGMQVFHEGSDEGELPGLGFFPGRASLFADSVKRPQMGWNTVTWENEMSMFRTLPQPSCFYFVHSYRIAGQQDGGHMRQAVADYGGPFLAAIECGRVWGTQFHPEKSGGNGLTVLNNFISLCKGD